MNDMIDGRRRENSPQFPHVARCRKRGFQLAESCFHRAAFRGMSLPLHAVCRHCQHRAHEKKTRNKAIGLQRMLNADATTEHDLFCEILWQLSAASLDLCRAALASSSLRAAAEKSAEARCKEIGRVQTPGTRKRPWRRVVGHMRGDVPVRCEGKFEGHQYPIGCIAVIPGSSLVVTGSSDETLRVWDVGDGATAAYSVVVLGHDENDTELHGLLGNRHDDTVTCVVPISPLCEGQPVRIVSGSSDTTCRVWDSESGACLVCLDGHTDAVNCLIELTSGQRLARQGSRGESAHVVSGSDDTTCRVWDPASGMCLHVLRGHVGEVTALTALDAGKLASGSCDESVRVWDATTGACLEVFQGHTASVRSLVSLPGSGGGWWLVSGSYDKTMALWELGQQSAGSPWAGSVCLCEARITCLCALSETCVGSGTADG